MNTIALQPCQQLQLYLQNQWQFQTTCSLPLQIRCAFQHDRLLVLAEHAPDLAVDEGAILAQLSTLLQKLDPLLRHQLLAEAAQRRRDGIVSPSGQESFAPLVRLQVGLCLRVRGEQKPYAVHGCWLQNSPTSHLYGVYGAGDQVKQPVEGVGQTQAEEGTIAPGPVSQPNHPDQTHVFHRLEPSGKGEASSVSRPSQAALFTGESEHSESQGSGFLAQWTQWTGFQSFQPFQSFKSFKPNKSKLQCFRLPLRLTQPDRSPDSSPATDEPETELNEGLQLPLAVWIVGIGLCLSTFIGGFWLVLQPCVLRACEPLIVAEQMGIEASLQITEAQNWQDLQAIEADLNQARSLLQRVPPWSRYYAQAQALDQRYSQDLEAFGPIVLAFEQAIEAVAKSQDPPHSVEIWQNAADLWQKAIVQLQTIPSDNPTYDLAQRKQVQYNGYLDMVHQQIKREKDALESLKNAEKAASLARKYQENAETLENWQSIQANWNLAIRALESIPEGTTAFQIAQTRLLTYQGQLATVNGKENEAQFAANLYNQAQEKAREAKAAEADNQWQVAATRWRTAIAALQEIPETSPYHDQVQTLVVDYNAALWQAELRQVGGVGGSQGVLDQVNRDLGALCAGTPTVCQFTVSAEVISVQLTLDYQQAVLSTGTLGDDQRREAALGDLQRLETALETISNNSRIPLKLYDPDGSLVGSHSPVH